MAKFPLLKIVIFTVHLCVIKMEMITFLKRKLAIVFVNHNLFLDILATTLYIRKVDLSQHNIVASCENQEMNKIRCQVKQISTYVLYGNTSGSSTCNISYDLASIQPTK